MFFRKNTTLDSSLIESKQNPKIKVCDLFTTDTEVSKFNEILKLLILSSNHAAAIAKNNLILFDPSNLKKIASISLNLQPNESIINLLEAENKELQVISYTSENKIRIQCYDIRQLDSPILTKELKIDLPISPNFIFRINDGYAVCFKDTLEVRNNDFSLFQSFKLNLSDLWGITPISDNQFLCTSSGSIFRFTRENNQYNYKHLIHYLDCLIKHMIYKNNTCIYLAEDAKNGYRHICIHDSCANTTKMIPVSDPHLQILGIGNIDDVLTMHILCRHPILGSDIKFINLNDQKTIASVPLEKTFNGNVFLLPSTTMLCCDTNENTLEIIDFPKLKSHRYNLMEHITNALPPITNELKSLIGEYAFDVSFILSEKTEDESTHKRRKK